eukprot:1179266-Prorocentrum_minimum.AAC.6
MYIGGARPVASERLSVRARCSEGTVYTSVQKDTPIGRLRLHCHNHENLIMRALVSEAPCVVLLSRRDNSTHLHSRLRILTALPYCCVDYAGG